MTTAHKPTFHPAVGTANQGGYRYHKSRQQFSSRDLPGHTKLKIRQIGQNTADEVSDRNLKRELEEREQLYKEEKKLKRQRKGLAASEPQLLLLDGKELEKFDDSDDSLDSSSDSDDSDEDDEEAELMRELAKIKAEREADRLKKEMEKLKADEKAKTERIMGGNPLLKELTGDDGADFTVKRRWDDDVVFRNQARDEPKVENRFINDPTRNDFHRKFMTKYIQ
eukprot:34124_1